MTTNQLRKIIAKAGMSQRGAAKELDISERMMRHYCAGDFPIPRAIEYALYYLTDYRG